MQSITAWKKIFYRCRSLHLLFVFMSFILGQTVLAQPLYSPPYSGFVNITPNIITPTDPSALTSVNYVKEESDSWHFELRFEEGMTTAAIAEKAAGSYSDAEDIIKKIAHAIGQLPLSSRLNVNTVVLKPGNQVANASLFTGKVNTFIDAIKRRIAKGTLEELLFHEAIHTSHDKFIRTSLKWLEAQRKDNQFLTAYAKSNRLSEDLSESLPMYFAYRYKRDRLTPDMVSKVERTMPNRIKLLDSMHFDLHPFADQASDQASITKPQAHSVLAPNQATFDVYGEPGVKYYDLIVGTDGPGSSDIRSSSTQRSTRFTVQNLPANGEKLFVRLWSFKNEWLKKDYVFYANRPSRKATLATPILNTNIQTTSLDLHWEFVDLAVGYDVIIGTQGAGSDNIRKSSTFKDNILRVDNIPLNAQKLYVKLWTNEQKWASTSHTFNLQTPNVKPAELVTPTAGSTLAEKSIRFEWTQPQGTNRYDLLVGTDGPGSTNLRASNVLSGRTVTVDNIPTDTSQLYVRLWSKGEQWKRVDYVFNTLQPELKPAELISPAPGSTLSSKSVTFNWNKPDGATRYDLIIGTTGESSSDIRASSQTTRNSITVDNMPADGNPVFVKLWSKSDRWRSVNYVFDTATPDIQPARLTNLSNGETLNSSTTTFTWSTPDGTDRYDLLVGTDGVASTNLRASKVIGTNAITLTNIPTDGRKVYVRLWSKGDRWKRVDYEFKTQTR